MAEESKRIEDADIELVKSLQTEYAVTTAQIGQVDVELHLLEKRISQINDARDQLFAKYSELEKKEQELVQTLSSKYGDGVLDLDSGRFIPSAQ